MRQLELDIFFNIADPEIAIATWQHLQEPTLLKLHRGAYV